MSATFLPGADDELRERVAVMILHLQVRRALRDTLPATGHAQNLRACHGHLRRSGQKEYLARLASDPKPPMYKMDDDPQTCSGQNNSINAFDKPHYFRPEENASEQIECH